MQVVGCTIVRLVPGWDMAFGVNDVEKVVLWHVVVP